ncbi:type II secretion system F family protein [Leifsonia sp. WHRI 6310E]|uniref:type II secretion system F family protein n=1 Tax=Leifsonia sp. WHRI 6310E TaxID=3162562 RepID=UPI0032EF87EB
MAQAEGAAFAYVGRDDDGRLVKGRLDASNEAAVAARLRALGLSPVSISPARAGTGLQMEISLGSLGRGVSVKDLAVMSRQMATMVSSGLALLRALNILAEQTENKTLSASLTDIAGDVEEGTSLSQAMGRHDRVFPPLMINMVRAGETGGFLDEALDSIAENFEKEAKLRSTIKSAMTYPVIVLVMSLVSVVAMLLFIVPVFDDMFKSLGGQLPWPTEILVQVSHAMVWVAPLLVVVTVAGWLWWRKNKNTEEVRRKVDPLKLRLPVFGPLMKKIAIARFSRNFANMLSAGVPILQALHVVGETSGNWVIANALERVADSVRQGNSIAGPLATETVFPTMVTQMIAVGEDAGSLEMMLSKIAEFYDQEVEATTEALTSLIEPLLIAFLGVIIGGMIVALYLPIFNIASLIK